MSAIFQAASLGNMEVRNRFVRSATWEGMAGENGEVTEPLINFYRVLASGGVGLIITGSTFVTKRGKMAPGQLGIDDDSLITGLRSIPGVVHEEGGKVAMQLVHGGSQVHFDCGMPPQAPSAVKERVTGNMPVEMTVDDIKSLVHEFSEASRRAKEAGFDGVQIHAAHGYLLSQFLSPYSNRRADDYGGSIENRARVIFEIYKAIREKVGKDYPVMIKINAADFDGEGLTPEDSLWVCRRLSEMDIDAIELSGGVLASGKLAPSRLKINRPEREAYFRKYAEQFSPGLNCPLMLVGGLRSPEVMEDIYNEGYAQFFSLSRPLISEPNLIRRWESGDRKKARCISCNKCFNTPIDGGRLYCATFNKEGKA